MAFNRKHIQLSGEFTALQKGTLIKSFDEVVTASAAAATTSTAGLVKLAATQGATDNSTAATVATALDALITKLKAAGIMA